MKRRIERHQDKGDSTNSVDYIQSLSVWSKTRRQIMKLDCTLLGGVYCFSKELPSLNVIAHVSKHSCAKHRRMCHTSAKKKTRRRQAAAGTFVQA